MVSGRWNSASDDAACPLGVVQRLRRRLTANIRRTADGKPDLQGFYESTTPGRELGPENARQRVAPAGAA